MLTAGVHQPLVIFDPMGCAGASRPNERQSRVAPAGRNPRSRTKADSRWAPTACYYLSRTNADSWNAVATCDLCPPALRRGIACRPNEFLQSGAPAGYRSFVSFMSFGSFDFNDTRMIQNLKRGIPPNMKTFFSGSF